MSELRRMLMAKKVGGGENLIFYDRLITDGTAYIDTTINPYVGDYMNCNVELEIKTNPTTWASAPSTGYVFGCRANSGQYRHLNLYFQGKSTWYGQYLGFSIFQSNGGALVADQKQLHLLSKGGYYINGVRKTGLSPTGSKAQTTYTCLLFAMNDRGTIRYGLGMDFYSFKFSLEDGTTIMQLKPCTYNGVAGMWDMVNNQFYGNANTSGSFSVAND